MRGARQFRSALATVRFRARVFLWNRGFGFPLSPRMWGKGKTAQSIESLSFLARVSMLFGLNVCLFRPDICVSVSLGGVL